MPANSQDIVRLASPGCWEELLFSPHFRASYACRFLSLPGSPLPDRRPQRQSVRPDIFSRRFFVAWGFNEQNRAECRSRSPPCTTQLLSNAGWIQDRLAWANFRRVTGQVCSSSIRNLAACLRKPALRFEALEIGVRQISGTGPFVRT